MGVRYDKKMTAKTKQEVLHLVTLDITGKFAKKDGVTYQGYLYTPEDVQKAWEFFEWLVSRDSADPPEKKAAKRKTPLGKKSR